ncbi:hypothetical protein [Flavihumibacter petaseus]|uniref:ABM domain-containing protein n=1 Tax=Flavihumibacter petaseus NBRC 106054 TaxID=1220578 RepID=A0A0E9MX05_9BACT|nr:hypothetical protein [Flavihumibacter petaseus]GAO42033.1 hypothetical protein FPE01S_01_10460 [Flavihumibacter petaseus NBRC 106054]
MKKVMVQFTSPGMTSKQYDQVWDELRKAGQEHPDGLLHHVGAQQGNNWVVVDVWESEERFNKFGETLMPILKKIGVNFAPPVITPVYFEMAGEVHA